MLKRKAKQKQTDKITQKRLGFFYIMVVLAFVVISVRLFFLQVIEYDFYEALASGQQEILQEIIPRRGEIFIKDKNGELYPVAQNQERYLLYAVPKELAENNVDIEELVNKLAQYFNWQVDVEDNGSENNNSKEGAVNQTNNASEKAADKQAMNDFIEKLKERLQVATDPYEPIRTGLTLSQKQDIEGWQIAGIYFAPKPSRFYPYRNIGSHVIGFYNFKSDNPKGQYGIEGYFDDILAGKRGQIRSARDAFGYLIAVAPQTIKPAEDGADLVLTIDQSIEYVACKKLTEYAERLGARGGSVIVVEPFSGAVMAMCNYPDFDPNNYFEVEDISVFNNPAISSEYEPGSIFKPITMAAGLDLGKITPTDTYSDEGCRRVEGWYKPICNSDIAQFPDGHGLQTMTQVLEQSLNTGAMYVVDVVGGNILRKYFEGFGFGKLTGITLPGEVDGNISNVGKQPIYSYTASFGQGITATPLQMVMAYAAIANGGQLLKPYIVDEIRYSNGKIEKVKPKVIRNVLSPSAATLLAGMLVSVVENGHGKNAAVPGYYIGGKTGTAQVPSPQGGYSDETIHSFVGFGPIDSPRFVMIVKLDNPGVRFSASSAAPLFGEIAKFILQYLQVPPNN